MYYFLIAVLIGLLIALHELGHLVAAKLSGIPVSRFSIGFGPRLLGINRKGTDYCLSAIPFGGYVLPALDPQIFDRLSARKRITFALGGPIANFSGAYFSLLLLNLLNTDAEFMAIVFYTAVNLLQTISQFIMLLPEIFSAPAELSGPAGIVAFGGQVLSEPGFGGLTSALLYFSALLNINLAILNLLPMPPLDGGRILFALLEKIWKPVFEWQQRIAIAGWAALLMLMIYATYLDISKFV